MSTPAATASHDSGIMTPEVTMIVLTWVAFISLLIILHKYAWKPILAGLDAREKTIREAVDNANRAKEELLKIEETRKKVIAEANNQAKELIESSRKGALEAAKIIQQKAKEEAQIVLENAQREMKAEIERAQAQLREESARVAVTLAEKLISANLDDDKNKKLVNQLIKEI